MVKLKKGQEAFQVVDGPDKGRTYERGVEYDKPPKGYEIRFETVKLTPKIDVKIKDKPQVKKGDK